VVAARAEAWEGSTVRRLLADPRWEKRFVRFLELSGVGRRNERRVSVCREDGYVDCMGITPRGDG
jgi:hypothetical protein